MLGTQKELKNLRFAQAKSYTIDTETNSFVCFLVFCCPATTKMDT
jgi:hypothetical protein